jgi:uncharacterized protein YkwD
MKKWIWCSIYFLGIVCISGTSQTDGNDQFKAEFLARINQVRQRGCNCGSTYMPPVQPLVWNDDLENAAKGHARDMAHKNYFSHESQDGRTMGDRIMPVINTMVIRALRLEKTLPVGSVV